MSNINVVVISGNIANELEVRYTPKGMAVLDFTVAVNNGFGDKQETAFIGCTAWSKTAESMKQFLGKGSKVNVQGRLSQDSWDDRETGKKRTKTKVIADRVEFIGSKRDAGQGGQQGGHHDSNTKRRHSNNSAAVSRARRISPGGDNDDDDIPF